MTTAREVRIAAPVRPAVSTRTRVLWMLLALLPGAALDGWTRDRWYVAWIAGACALATVLPQYRKLPARQRNPAPLLRIVLVALWLPPAPAWILPVALLVLIAIEFLLGQGDASNPFHPVMLACALVAMWLPQLPIVDTGGSWSAWIAAAYAIAGICLMVARCIRWQAPLAMLVGIAMVLAAWTLAGPSQPLDATLAGFLPPLALIDFFIADDPPRACLRARARMLSGLLSGILTTAAILCLHATHHDPRIASALAGVVLLMNAAAPWLDQLFRTSRPSAIPPA